MVNRKLTGLFLLIMAMMAVSLFSCAKKGDLLTSPGAAATPTPGGTVPTPTPSGPAYFKHFGGASFETAKGAARVADGYVITGYSNSFGNGNQDMYIVKTGLNGDLLWQKVFGGIYNDQCYSIRPTLDGNLIVCGSSDISATAYSGDSVLELAKFDTSGNILWDRKFSAPGTYASGITVEQALDGGYVGAGYCDNSPYGYLVKVDAAGNTVWINNIMSNFSSYDGLAATVDGGYISSHGETLVKLDASGNTVWNQYYGDYSAWESTVRVTADAGYLLSGTNYSYAAGGNYDFFAIKADASGNCQWAKTWDFTGLGSQDNLYHGMQDSSGNYIFTGNSDNAVAVLKTDSAGNMIWFKKYGPGANMVQDSGAYIMESADNKYIITGTTFSGGSFGDYFIMKVDPATGDKIW